MPGFKKILFFLVSISIHSIPAEGQLFKLFSTIQNLVSPVTCLLVSPDGNTLISGDSAGTIVLRNCISGKIIKSENGFHSAIENISFNSTGRLMLVNTREGEIKIYDFVPGKFIQSLYSPEYTDMRFALFSIADGFIYFNGQGRLYKTRSDLTQPVLKIYDFDSVITNAVITDDRSALIFSCGNAVKVLNTRTDNIVQEVIASQANIFRLTLSSESKLVTWSSDGTILIRKYEFNQLSNQLLLWFKAGASSKLTLSHDGRMMVTGRVGTWARIWKPFERNIMQELFGHQGEVTDFVFSIDDKTLFTASQDRTIKIWKQDLEKEKEKPQIKDDNPHTTVGIRWQDTANKMPAIEIDASGSPAFVGGRKVNKRSVVELNDSIVDIYVFDNSSPDGDILSLSFQDQWILTHYEVTKQKKKLVLHLNPGSNNYLTMFADNLGYTPPNTAAISFDLDGHQQIFTLQSDLKTCSSVNFIYKSK